MKKVLKIIENCFIIIIFFAVVLFPWIAINLGMENNLSGAEEKIELRFDTLDKYIMQNFPGRELLVRTKNQLLYSLFDVSPNDNIIKIDDTLIASETMDYYFHGLHHVGETEVNELLKKLITINGILKEKGKKMVVITTPTKPRYYEGRLPFADDIILAYQEDFGRKSYEMLRDGLIKSDIFYFDCINYIDTHKEKIMGGEVPLFYKGAHHWSNYKGNLVGLGFADFMRNTVKVKMPKMKLHASPSETAVYPDSDLFDVLNIYDKPNEDFYSSEKEYINYDNDNLDYLIQGGSFLGGLMLPYLTLGMDNKILHIENKFCIYNKYVDSLEFESYDDLDKKLNVLNQLKDFDVVIFEINELAVYNASFGFLDYLLEHKEKI